MKITRALGKNITTKYKDKLMKGKANAKVNSANVITQRDTVIESVIINDHYQRMMTL